MLKPQCRLGLSGKPDSNSLLISPVAGVVQDISAETSMPHQCDFMSLETQIYYAKKFFAHLHPSYGVLCIRVSLKAHGIPFDDSPIYAQGFV